MLYLAENQNEGYYKIGYTSDIKKRIRCANSDVPFSSSYQVISTRNGEKFEEGLIHRFLQCKYEEYCYKHGNGSCSEWYSKDCPLNIPTYFSNPKRLLELIDEYFYFHPNKIFTSINIKKNVNLYNYYSKLFKNSNKKPSLDRYLHK